MKSIKLGLIPSLFLIACGGGGGGDPVAVENLGTELTTSFCTKTFDCCTAEEITEEYSFFGDLTDEADCVAKLTPFLAGNTAKYQASIAAGKLIYHADRAGDCLAAQDSSSCNVYSAGDAPSPACDTTFEGLVANDAACDLDEECVSQYCEGLNPQDETPGTCKTLPAIGEACPSDECATGAYCQFGSESECVAVKADGESCNSDEECTNGCNFANDVGTCGTPTSCDGL